MKRILLLVENPGNMKVLSDFLKNYELTVGKDNESISGDFDLCIIDVSAFRRAKTSIRRKKEAQRPVFMPFLLVATIDEFRSIASSSTHLIDELLLTPVTPQVMQTRISRMFEERENSITLKNTRDNAIEKLKTSNELLEERVGERAGQIVENQKLLQSIINNSPAIIYLKDTEGRYTLINREFEKSLDVNSKKILGKNDFNIHPEEIAEIMVANDKKVLDSKRAISFEEELSRPDGIYTYLSVKFPIKNAQGKIYGICGMSTNITDRKRAETELKAERRRLDTILATLPVGVLLADSTGCIYHANNVAKNIWAASNLEQLNERKGRSSRNGQVLHNNDWELKRSISTGNPSVGKIIDIDKFDGSQATVLDSATPLINSQGVVEGAVAIVQDITKQRQRERLSDSLNKINSIIFSTIDFGKIVTDVLTMTVEAAGCEAAALGIVKQDSIEFEYACKMTQEIKGEKLSVRDSPALADVLKNKQVFVANDTYKDKRVSQEIVRKYNIRSVAIVPLIAHGKVFAMISYYYMSAPRAFSGLQLDFINKLGASMSLALQNSDLYNSMQREITRIALLKEIASATTSTLSIIDVCNETLEITNSYLDASAGSIYYYDEQRHALDSLAIFGWPEKFLDDIKRIPLESDSNQVRVIKQGLKIMTHESPDQTQASLERLRAAGLDNSRWFIVPIITKGKLIGSFSLAFEGLRSFTIDEVSLYRSIAEQLATAIENARLYESEVAARRQAKNELEASNILLRAASTLNQSLESSELLQTLTGVVSEFTGRSRIAINLLDKDTNELIVSNVRGVPSLKQGTRLTDEDIVKPVRNAIASRKSVVIDYEGPEVDPEHREEYRQFGASLVLWVPIVFQGETIGGIAVDEPGERRPFTQRDIDLIEGIAAQAAITVDRAQIYENVRREKEFNQVLGDINRTMLSTTDFNSVAGSILKKAAGLMGIDVATVLVSTDGGYEVQARHPDQGVGTRLAVEEVPFITLATEQRTSVVITNAQQDPRVNTEVMKKFGVWAVIGVPLIIKEVLIGALVFSSREGPVKFDSAQIGFAEKLATAVALAIRNSELNKAREEELIRTTILKDIAAVASSAFNIDQKTSQILNIVRSSLNIKHGSIYLHNKDANVLELSQATGDMASKFPELNEAPVNNDTLMGRIMLTKKEYIAYDASDQPAESIKMMKRLGLEDDRAIIMAIPVRDQFLGVINFAFEGKRPFSDDEISLYHSISEQLGIAIDNSRLYEAEVEAKKRATSELELSKLLGKTSQILASSVELPKLISKLDDLSKIICQFTGRSRVAITLIDHQKREIQIVAVSGPSTIEVGSKFDFDDITHEFRQNVINKKRSSIIDYDKMMFSKKKKILGDYDIKRGLAVPITAKGQTVASILIDEPGQKVHFDEWEIRLVESLASQLGVALERARLYEAERTIADTLQTALLTIPETIKGIEFSHIYRSATEIAQVGGDFYDLFELEHDRVGILLGDVSGKGLNAATLTSLVKNIVKAYALEGESPGKIMSRANDIVYRESAPGTFVTVFMAILDLQTGKLSYCNAGHPPPIIKKSVGDTIFVNDTSPVIGVFKSFDYPVKETSIGTGDALVLYTDGAIEARRGKKFYGDDRLLRTVKRSKAGTKDLTAELYKDVNDFTGGNLTDDLAIVTLSLNKKPATAQTKHAA